jgi:hypothetical protein
MERHHINPRAKAINPQITQIAQIRNPRGDRLAEGQTFWLEPPMNADALVKNRTTDSSSTLLPCRCKTQQSSDVAGEQLSRS